MSKDDISGDREEAGGQVEFEQAPDAVLSGAVRPGEALVPEKIVQNRGFDGEGSREQVIQT
jgi:hypothetical protein